MICGTLFIQISLCNYDLQVLDCECDFLAVDDLGRGDHRVEDNLDVRARLKHHLLALAYDHYLGVLAVNEDEAVAGGDIIFALELKDFLAIIFKVPSVELHFLLGLLYNCWGLGLNRCGSFLDGYFRESIRVLLVRVLLNVLEGTTYAECLSLDLSQEIASRTASWGLGRCGYPSEFFLRLTVLVRPELSSVSGTLPVSDLVLVVHNEIDKGTGDGNVSLLPCSVLVLLELKDFKTIEVDGVDGLFLPFLVEKGVSGPSKHAEAIRNSLDMKSELEIFVLKDLDISDGGLNMLYQEELISRGFAGKASKDHILL